MKPDMQINAPLKGIVSQEMLRQKNFVYHTLLGTEMIKVMMYQCTSDCICVQCVSTDFSGAGEVVPRLRTFITLS